MSNKYHDPNFWGGSTADTPDDTETPESDITLSGGGAGQGLSTFKGGGMMLSVRPAVGSRRVIPYSRIEEIEFNRDSTRCVLYASGCIVTIEGAGLDGLENALQRAIASVIAVGKAASNDVTITRITITDAHPHYQAEEETAASQG